MQALNCFRRICCSCDSTKVSLILAWCGGLGLTLRDVIYTYQQGCSVHRRFGFRTFCVVEILDTLFLLPCTIQLLFLVATYSEKVQQHLREIEEQQTRLAENYRRAIHEKHESLKASVKSNIELAHKNFLQERKDFLRFLDQLQETLHGVEDLELAQEVRKFIVLWLRIYTETFRRTESQETRHAEQLLEKCENVAQVLQQTRVILQQTNFETVLVDSFDLSADVRGLLANLEPPTVSMRGCACGPDWIQLKSRCRCHMDEESIDCCLCHVDLLDTSHGLLLIALIAGTLLVFINLVFFLLSARTVRLAVDTLWDLLPLLLYLLCLTLILCRFERVCFLGRQHGEWTEQRREAFLELSSKMTSRWELANNLVELWDQRTLPRLELLKELHCRLSMLPRDELRAQLLMVNSQVSRLEDVVGDVQSWWQAQQEGRPGQRALRPSVVKLLRGLSLQNWDDFPEQLDSLRGEMVDATSFGSVGSAGALELTAAGVAEEVPEAAPEAPRNLDSFCASEPRNLDSFVASPRNLDSFLRQS